METFCPIIGRNSEVEETKFSKDSWSVVRCRETGFVFLKNPPDYSQLVTDYAFEKTSAEERQRRHQDEPIVTGLSQLARRLKRILFPKRNKTATISLQATSTVDHSNPLHILDVGCGSGWQLLYLAQQYQEKDQEVVLHGIEVSKQQAREAKQRLSPLGGDVACTNALEGSRSYPADSMDLIVMRSFLEHECQPLELLNQLHSLLKGDGVIVLKVPNFGSWNRMIRGRKWCGFRYPDHVNYFTPATLSRLMQEAGFEVSRMNLLDKFPLSDSMYAVVKKAA